MPLTLLDSELPCFPPAAEALDEPAGLLAVGGNLEVETLLQAYRSGIFPWFSEEDPICWWSPDPREVMLPGDQHWSRSMRRFYQNTDMQITTDQAFAEVMRGCSREDIGQAWITPAMRKAYERLFALGHAHSVEVWQNGELVAGLYGVAVGGAFCGESMFHRVSNSSKLAFLVMADTLFACGFNIIDCQFQTHHLRTLGSQSISRAAYLQWLHNGRQQNIAWPTTFVASLV